MTSKPILVLMAGIAGTGKSTLALALGKALDWPVLDKDTLKSGLLKAGTSEEIAAGTAYELLFDLAQDLLAEQRFSVILDSPATFPITVERATELAGVAGAYLKVVLCVCGLELHTLRLAERVERASQPVSPEAPDAMEDSAWRRFVHLPAETLHVKTTQPVTELVARVLPYLRDQRHAEAVPDHAGGDNP